MPQPTPVPILTNRKSLTVRLSPACLSPSAMMFTSLSTRTGAPRCCDNTDRTGNWSQPGMIGGATGTPSRKLTGPGTPTPAPWISGAMPVRPQLVHQLEGDREDDVGALPHVRRLARVRDDLAARRR